MKKKVFVIILSILLFFCSFVIVAGAQYDSILTDGSGCLFTAEIVATGQGGDLSNIFIGIGSESYNYPYPPNPPPAYTVAMWIKGDGNNKYLEDIRETGLAEEVWRVQVMVSGPEYGGTADMSKPGFYPVLNWDPNTICPKDTDTGYSLKLYSEDEMGNLTLLVPDMSQISQYQTKEEDALQCVTSISYCSFVYYIAWSRPKACIFTAEIKATGQLITGNENNISRVFIGIDYSASKVESPPFAPPDSTVVLNISDEGENLNEDIREQGPEEEEWKLRVIVANSNFNGAADPNEPGFFPVLSWNPNAFCPPDPNTNYFRLYSEDDQGRRTMLVPDMSKAGQYQTKEEDGRCTGDIICTFTYYIVWSKDVDFEMDLSAGWSMISLPVAPLDARLSTLFPDVAVMYRFERGAGYARVQPNDELHIGTGYWMLIYEDQNYMLTGQPIPSYGKTVYSSGWEMIGGCTFDAMPSADSCQIGVIYSFDREIGYERILPTEVMEPGEGFWILLKDVADQCDLTVEAIGPLSRSRENSDRIRLKPGPQDEFWGLYITAKGQSCGASSIKIGIDPNGQASPYPQSPPPNFTAILRVKGDTGYFIEDLRTPGSPSEVWEIEVMVAGPDLGGSADIDQPDFYPLLTWDLNQMGQAKVMDLRLGDANGPVLLDMRTTTVYPTKQADILNPSVNYDPEKDYALFSYTIVFEPFNTYYRDADNDGFGDPNDWIQTDIQPQGYVPGNWDCDDNDPNTYTGAPELCDGIDNDCDGLVPPAEITDSDSDGFVDCKDCDDNNPNMYPDNPEVCDGKDNNCDGLLPVAEMDFDGDGFRGCEGDCDNNNNTVYPGAPELCDGIDNNCNGIIDDPNALSYSTYFSDSDDDGYGNSGNSTYDCKLPVGYVTNSNDCDDTDAAINPGAIEICDGKDNNCDGSVPANEADIDGDGVRVCEGDCNDSNSATHPGAVEACDGIDNNCDGIVPADEEDGDGDGVMICDEDCDDTDAEIYPNAPEICDGKDNNCDGTIPADEADEDSDGFMICENDCDDTDPAINPNAPELCDGIDNNCNSLIDDPNEIVFRDYYHDADNDGYGDPNDSQNACSQPDGYVPDSSDCDDGDANINPAAEEIYDGIDNNCDGGPDEQWYFVGNLIATGQESTGQVQKVDVEFGLDWGLAGILIDPNNWADNVVRLQLIDALAVDDTSNLVDTDYLISDIRNPSGQTAIAWYVLVEIGDEANPNDSGYYPVLSWDTNSLGYTEVNGKDYVYQLISGLGETGTVLVDNMSDTNFYMTGPQDGDPIQYFTILWTQKPLPPAPAEKKSQQFLPWPGVHPGALGWVGIPFSAGFPGGLPSQLTSGYAPGLSIASFPGTYPGFTYPGWKYPSWTSYVPRLPSTFPTLGLFVPVGIGWPGNYWIGYPQSSYYKTGWFYQYR